MKQFELDLLEPARDIRSAFNAFHVNSPSRRVIRRNPLRPVRLVQRPRFRANNFNELGMLPREMTDHNLTE